MSETGKFVKMGTKMGTTYPEKGDATWDLIEDFYQASYGFAKSAGAATYGDNGYFNAIMGKEITAAMFASDNVFTALGARPYNHEGVRIALELATYGLDAAGNFVGAGAETIQDGNVAESVQMPVNEYRQPYKDLTFAFDYGLGLQALENKDDTIAYRDYIDKMSANWSDLIDKTLLRPVYLLQPKQGGVETSLNSLGRLTSSYAEGQALVAATGSTYDGSSTLPSGWTTVADVASYICPYGGANGDFVERAAHVSNLDSQFINLNQGALALEDVKKLWRMCSVNWKDSAAPNNKVWIMSNIAQDKLASLMMANNVYLESVYAQRSFNGVKTIPGRDAGMLLKSYNNIPIIQDGNVNFDFTTKKVSNTIYGDIFLLDLDHIWMSMLTPVQMYNIDNPAITRMLRERNLLHMRMETRIDSFIQSGKITNIAAEA